MTKLDRNRIEKIEREEWRLCHPGWWQERALNIVMIIISVLIGILIFYWCSMARITEVEAAVFHKEADRILYVERLDTTLGQKPEFPPKAIEVGNSSPSNSGAEIESSDMATDSNAEESTPKYSEEELYIMAHVLCGEVQTGSRELQVAVGSVVLNRVASTKYPNTIKGVVFQKRQYACTWDGNYYRTPTARNWEVAKFLLENGSQIPSNVVYQAQFRQGKGVWRKIGTETFCYE